MKKTTVIIVLVAAALAAFVYFYDLKHNKPSSSSGDTDADTSGSGEDTTKPAFTFTPSDVATMTIERAGTAVALEKRADAYYMTQPYATRADQSGVGAIAGELASVRVSRTITATPEQLATFGLTKPEVEIDFSLKNGAKHKLNLGAKDFSGTSVYALVDDSKDVSILPDTILTSSNKPADDFRDQSVLSFQTSDAVSFDLKNEFGEIAASKHDSTWKIEKPRPAVADSTAVSSFLDTLATAQVASFVDDTSPNAVKYGLAKPVVSFRVELGGGKSVELEVGKKDGDSYYARQTSQPFIFRIKETLYKTLGQKLFDFRDKQLVHVSEDDVVRLDIQDAGATEACVKDSNGERTSRRAQKQSRRIARAFGAHCAMRGPRIFSTRRAARSALNFQNRRLRQPSRTRRGRRRKFAFRRRRGSRFMLGRAMGRRFLSSTNRFSPT